ncbi:MAG: lysophospholipid acyltransferase family protein [Mangrovibacterium sp.]
MTKLLSYILTPISLLLFCFYLFFFHIVQLVCQLFSERVRQKSIVPLCYMLSYCPLWVGAKIKFEGFKDIPENRPLVILSNHQSALDIPALVVGFKNKYMRFVAKKSLEKGVPSVSHNLKVGGSALIDRSNPRQAIGEIAKLGKLVEKENGAVSIFPEGTRTRNGKMRKFQSSGVTTLLKYTPSALVIPVVIQGNYELSKDGIFPLPWGVKLNYTALTPIETKDKTGEEVTLEAENAIREYLGE